MAKTWKRCKGHPYRYVPAGFRRDRNRLYRARCKQMMREGKYALIPRPVRDALWHYW